MAEHFGYDIDRRYLPLLLPFLVRRSDIWHEQPFGRLHPFRSEGAISTSTNRSFGADGDGCRPRGSHHGLGRRRRSAGFTFALRGRGRTWDEISLARHEVSKDMAWE